MKFKYLFVGLVFLVLVAGSLCVFAQEITLDDDYKFTISEDVTAENQTEDGVDLKIDDDHYVVVQITDDSASTQETIEGLQNQGFEVTANNTTDIDGISLEEIDYTDGEYTYYLYSWNVDDDCVIACYACPLNESVSWDNSPVKSMFDSFTEI